MLAQYPPALQRHLREIAAALGEVVRPTALLLLGSAARGELSYLRHPDGRLELFSDYEFLAVFPSYPTRFQRRAIQTLAEQWQERIANPNPLFHIDIITRGRRHLAAMPPLIFTFESKQNGLPLHGEDVRPQIPDVTLQNLDFRNTHEILYKRLWAILLHLPKRFVLGQASEAERRVAGYVLCRNALDLTTVLLPHEGILLPTYRQRVEYLTDHYPDLELSKTFGPDLPGFLQRCLARRRDLDFSGVNLHELYATVTDSLRQALQMLLPTADPVVQALPHHSRRIFNEWPISRGEWLNLVRLLISIAQHQGLAQARRWLRTPKKGWLTVGLLAMHESLLAWFAGRPVRATEWLERSQE
ncbi:MAG TPA: hypothetical protein EYP49_10395, partial [Anaerolineae bacterium]|nr:hypothetical protein [Anaerolineae bacterium]